MSWWPCACQRRLLALQPGPTTWLDGCERLERAAAGAGENGGLRSHVSVPLTAGGRIFGLLNLATRKEPPADVMALLDVVGVLVSLGLEWTAAVAEARAAGRREHHDALELARSLLNATGVEGVGGALFPFLREVFQADALSLLVVDPTGAHLTLLTGWGWSQAQVGRLQLPLNPPESSGPAWALRMREPVLCELERPERPFFIPEAVRQAGVKLSLFLPMLSGDRPVGVVVVDWLDVRPVGPDQVRFGALLTGIAANALARVLELQRYRRLIEGLPVGAYRSTPDGRFLAVNRALVRLLGYPDPASLLATPVPAVYVDPKDRARWQRLIGRKGTLRGFEVRWRRFDGTPVWVRESARAVRDASGRVVYYEGTVEDVTEKRQAEERARFLAEHDPLTGLFNRHRFQVELARRLSLTRRKGRPGAVLLIDLDNFKAVNDLLGHQAGDQLLKELAVQLRGRLRRAEVLARLGGDEFGAVLFPADADQARRVAERLVATVRERTALLGGGGLKLGASCGIAVFPDHGDTVDEVLAAADRALYAAKGQGGDQVYVGGPNTVSSGGPVGDRIAQALTEGRLEILAQPILDLRTGRVSQYELLARLQVGASLLKPAAFLEAVERLGLAAELDLKVLAEALRLARESGLQLHVNVSGRTLNNQAAVDRMVQMLESAGLPAGRLVLEITEQTVLADLGQTRRHLEMLRDKGYRLALDDFGAGFSSFHYLRHLQVDYVKIDGSLIRDLPRDGRAQKIVGAIAALIRDLGGLTVVEWVEDEATLRAARELGADYAQGFYIGPPGPVAGLGDGQADRNQWAKPVFRRLPKRDDDRGR